jgi:transcriptional regulator with XRE-family HTH domain
MSTSHLGRAVAFISTQRGTTQSQIAANAGLSQVLLSRACSGTRPEAKTLRALCTCQPDPRDNVDLLVAHLLDEVERAGHSTHEVHITAAQARLDDDLRLLLEEATHDEQLATLLRKLASFARTHPLRAEPATAQGLYTTPEEPMLMVAEEQATYGAHRKSSKKAK